MRLAQGEIPSGMVVSEQINDLDSLPFPRWDLVTEDRGKRSGSRWSSRPVGGGYPLLASRGCPEFCTYCPHRILAGYRARSIANIADELERLCDQVRRAVRHLPRPAVQRAARALSRAVRRDPGARPDADVRGRRPGSIGSTSSCSTSCTPRPGFRAMSFGVESLSPATLKKVGPAADPRSAPARDHRALPQARHRDGGVLRARVPAGRLELDRRDDRLRDRPRIDLRAVQDPDAVSRHADVQAARAAAHRNRLGEVRRLHADVRAPEPDGAASSSSCSARPTSASTCGRRTWRTS